MVGASGTAGTLLSDIIDLRDKMIMGKMSLTYGIGSTAGTAGSSVFSYLVSPTEDGTFRPAGTFGTHGDVLETDVLPISSPILAPFAKIKVVTGTSCSMLMTGELHVV
jgi:hypothetical protein